MMLEFRDALLQLADFLKNQHITESDTLPLAQCLDRIVAKDIVSTLNVPPTDNSAMDGFAINIEDAAKIPVTLPVSQRIAAGAIAQPHMPGSAARIFTGAEIPIGANCVVMQENCEQSDDGKYVKVKEGNVKNNNIRNAGQDITIGKIVAAQGTKLTPEYIGLLASIGIAELPVYRRLKVAVFSTGDELIPPGQTLAQGQIYDSNRAMLIAMCEKFDCTVLTTSHLPDDINSTINAFQQSSTHADVIISCGGVSVGDEDHVKNALEAIGKLTFWKVRIKPGKPFAFGEIGKCKFIGLPGNPVSAFVTFLLFGQTIIAKLQGNKYFQLPSYYLKSDFSLKKSGTRPEFMRIKAQNSSAIRYPNQSSGALSSVSWADALALIPDNVEIKQNDLIEVFPL